MAIVRERFDNSFLGTTRIESSMVEKREDPKVLEAPIRRTEAHGVDLRVES